MKLRFKGMFIAYFYDKDGYYQELRRFYPEISLELQIAVDEIKNNIKLEVK